MEKKSKQAPDPSPRAATQKFAKLRKKMKGKDCKKEDPNTIK